jgi:proteasome accessory factor B
LPAEAKAVQNSRFQRVFRLLSYLQSGPRFNADQLAHQFQVSRRTIFRDIMFLREMGIPVVFDEGNGAYRLSAQFRIARVLSASGDELAMLFLAAHLSLVPSIPELGAMVREAAAKLLCNLPEENRTQIANLLNACRLDLDLPVPDSRIVKSIFKAIRLRRQIRISTASDGPVPPLETKVAPYRFVATAGRWLLIGRSSIHRSVQTFDVATIKRVDITEDTYSVPQGFRHRCFLPDGERPGRVSEEARY